MKASGILINKYTVIILLIGFLLFLTFQKCSTDGKDIEENISQEEKEIEDKITITLSKMSLEEKVGQMTQVTLDVVSKIGSNNKVAEPHELDPVRLDSALSFYHVGSILNVGYHTFEKSHWHQIIDQINTCTNKKTKLKIPVIYGIDAIHGATYTVGATLFPQEIGLAATWNPELVETGASVTAYEVRASHIPWNFSPVLDLGRQPLWSRFFETFGEDVHLSKVMGKAMIKGYQGNNIAGPYKLAACLKHYVGYSFPLSGKDRTPAWIPERYIREYFLPTFEEAVKDGALTVMVNSSEINGIPGHANYHLLTEVLKGELGFKGFAVSDWEDIIMLYTVHKIASSEKDAVKIAIMAGTDMSMVPYNYRFCKYLVELVNEKQVPIERIDDAVRRILRVKYKLNLFEQSVHVNEKYEKFGSDEFAQASFQSALESMTLLKNDNSILPLSKNDKVLIVGPAANSLNYLNGAWTSTWQGIDSIYNTKNKPTIVTAISDKIGVANVRYVQGTSYDKDININQAVLEAKRSKIVIICLGEIPATEKEGDIDDLSLPAKQIELVNKISATGIPVILVLVQGRPRIISTIEPLAKGIVLAYIPGNEGGRAIADVLFGDFNPGGKLPYTYPLYTGALVKYDHKYSEKRGKADIYDAYKPQYDFGYGLSYTKFDYSNLTINKDTINGNEVLKIMVKIMNVGKVKGHEVVQLYIKDLYASITPSVKRLRGFKKIALSPGESSQVTFYINPTELAFVGLNDKWVTESGDFEVQINNIRKKFCYVKNSNNVNND